MSFQKVAYFSGPSIPKMLGVENEDAHTSDAGLVPVILAGGKFKVIRERTSNGNK